MTAMNEKTPASCLMGPKILFFTLHTQKNAATGRIDDTPLKTRRPNDNDIAPGIRGAGGSFNSAFSPVGGGGSCSTQVPVPRVASPCSCCAFSESKSGIVLFVKKRTSGMFPNPSDVSCALGASLLARSLLPSGKKPGDTSGSWPSAFSLVSTPDGLRSMAIEDVVGQQAAAKAGEDDKTVLMGIFVGVMVALVALVVAFVYQVNRAVPSFLAGDVPLSADLQNSRLLENE